jgi:hypothetical protein
MFSMSALAWYRELKAWFRIGGDSTETLDRTSPFLDKRIGDTLGLIFTVTCVPSPGRIVAYPDRTPFSG